MKQLTVALILAALVAAAPAAAKEGVKATLKTTIPVGSYNVQFAAGRLLTPSLNAGTLCVLDAEGRLRERVEVAASSHDACLARS